ncbi:hypothetical protein HYV85_02795 [Candidatus Woesearchaeota archaeon]|nr:hypothetical protein [Candidatus Woesearchaeota archaeon]
MADDRLSSFTASDRQLISEFQARIGNVDWVTLEEFILKNPEIARPVIGHCFETWFDKLIWRMGYSIQIVGGDDAVDRKLNGKTLQLKTPYKNGTIPGRRVAYALHKTHGLEKRPANLYKPEDFADFLIGKIDKGKLLICPKDKIPKNSNYQGRKWLEYLADPAYFDWDCEWVNRFDLLGIKFNGSLPDISNGSKVGLFPKLEKITELSDIEIIGTLMKPENFRVLEQNLKGSIRQLHFKNMARRQGVELHEPAANLATRTKIKVDFVDVNGKRIQVKGRTKTLCNGNIVGIEVKGSHGRIPQRLYRKSDFDFLGVVLDPGSIPETLRGVNTHEYNFVTFPVDSLPIHENSGKTMYPWTMKFRNGSRKTLYSSTPKEVGVKPDANKTKEWADVYLKDVFYFDVAKVKLNDFSMLKPKN